MPTTDETISQGAPGCRSHPAWSKARCGTGARCMVPWCDLSRPFPSRNLREFDVRSGLSGPAGRGTRMFGLRAGPNPHGRGGLPPVRPFLFPLGHSRPTWLSDAHTVCCLGYGPRVRLVFCPGPCVRFRGGGTFTMTKLRFRLFCVLMRGHGIDRTATRVTRIRLATLNLSPVVMSLLMLLCLRMIVCHRVV